MDGSAAGRIDAAWVEGRLIEAMRVWRWGRQPGPAMQRERIWANYHPAHGDLDFSERLRLYRDHLEMVASKGPSPDRAMIDRAAEAAGWLALVPEWRRAMLIAVVARIEAGGAPRWAEVTAEFADPSLTPGAAKMAYRRSVAALALVLRRQALAGAR